MTPNLHGEITLNKRLRRHPVWSRPDYGYCWIDLLMLANDKPRRAFVNGAAYELDRGQLLWSKRSLEQTWSKSDKWVGKFLEFCQDEQMIRVDSNNRRTIITILNYEAYNPEKSGTESGAESVTESVTPSGTESGRNWEVGTGNRKGERATPPPERPFAEVPDESEIQAFCADYRDLSRGVSEGIPEIWWRGWFANVLAGNRPFPVDWKAALKSRFTADLVARHPKATGLISAQPLNGLENKKNGAPNSGGQTAAQVRFKLDRELEAVRARLDAAYEIDVAPAARDVAREKELKSEIEALEQ